MNELPVFISYRKVDGRGLAQWVYRSLLGRSWALNKSSISIPIVISPFIDFAAPAVPNWPELHKRELENSHALIVVCSPGAMHEFKSEEVDWLYSELRWWTDNRPRNAPVLVTSSDHGPRYVPDLIHACWPKAQVVEVHPKVFSGKAFGKTDKLIEGKGADCIESILGGIVDSAGEHEMRFLVKPWRSVGMTNTAGLYTWEKDLHYRYINANDNYARAAGFDSPAAMIGKSDDQMPWCSLADHFRADDHKVMSGAIKSRVCVTEKEIMVDRVADILVSESALRNRHGRIVGLTGCFFDITGRMIVPTDSEQSSTNESFDLGREFGNAKLSLIELEVLRRMIGNIPAEQIAADLDIRRSELESHIVSMKIKLQCETEADLAATAVRTGLPLSLFGLAQEPGSD